MYQVVNVKETPPILFPLKRECQSFLRHYIEPLEKGSILFKRKEGVNFNRWNIFNISIVKL
jgi:hypothetical protein